MCVCKNKKEFQFNIRKKEKLVSISKAIRTVSREIKKEKKKKSSSSLSFFVFISACIVQGKCQCGNVGGDDLRRSVPDGEGGLV